MNKMIVILIGLFIMISCDSNNPASPNYTSDQFTGSWEKQSTQISYSMSLSEQACNDNCSDCNYSNGVCAGNEDECCDVENSETMTLNEDGTYSTTGSHGGTLFTETGNYTITGNTFSQTDQKGNIIAEGTVSLSGTTMTTTVSGTSYNENFMTNATYSVVSVWEFITE